MAHTTRKVYATLNSLKQRKNILSTANRKLLITALVIPILDYCSLVLIDNSKRLDYKLQCLMNSSIRFIFDLKRDDHITPYRRSLKWLSIKSKRLYLLACFLYKLFSSGEPKYLRCLFIEESQDIRRSERLASKYNNISFSLPSSSTAVYEHSFLISSIRLWREIPLDIINSLSIEAFKSKAFDFFYDLELRET